MLFNIYAFENNSLLVFYRQLYFISRAMKKMQWSARKWSILYIQ